MRALLYCVLSDAGAAPSTTVAGVGGHAVSYARARGLRAAFSHIEDAELIPSLSRLLDYDRVVEALFGQTAVLPMRYGATFASEADLIRYVEEHAHRLSASLRELEGCVEMGVRVLLLAGESAPTSEPAPHPAAPTSGRAYLESLRKHLDAADPLRARREAALERCSRAFAGVVVRQRAESSSDERRGFERLLASVQACGATAREQPRLLGSLHFLVRRESVVAFKERFRDLRPEAGTELLISGPWPPYSFAAPESQIPCMTTGPSHT